jgi:hypothetical protein
VEFLQGIFIQEPLERCTPHPSRGLQVLLYEGLEKCPRHRSGQRALRKLVNEVMGDRVLQLRDRRVPYLLHARFVSQDGWRAKKDESHGALGVVYREAPGDEAATGTANDDGSIETELIHERRQVSREIAGMIAPRGTARITMTPLRHGERVDGLGQIRQHRLERTPGVRDGVQKHYGNA